VFEGWELLALVLAAAGHDAGHPGKTSNAAALLTLACMAEECRPPEEALLLLRPLVTGQRLWCILWHQWARVYLCMRSCCDMLISHIKVQNIHIRPPVPMW
jgi:hypothetical protein